MFKTRSERDLCDGKKKALMRLMGRRWSKEEVGSERVKRTKEPIWEGRCRKGNNWGEGSTKMKSVSIPHMEIVGAQRSGPTPSIMT